MFQHQSVLLDQAVDALITDASGFYVDGTFGRGGHSRLILERLSENGRLLVVDKDPEAIEKAAELSAEDARVIVSQGSFADLAACLEKLGKPGKVQGLLLDLGVSSPQLDDAERGFSFVKDGPLDMRMNPHEGSTATVWLASATEKEIADVLYRYGEERFSRRMARAIVHEREKSEISRTFQLAEIVKQANPSWEKHKHPATRAFQAIRIFINNELTELETVLEQSLDMLATKGRLVVISFHSLEDRIVKQFIRRQEKGDDFPPGVPVMQSQLNPRLRKVGKVIRADAEELSNNIRARSAVMRVAEKIA